MATAARAEEAAGPSGRTSGLLSILPLELLRSQLVPPAPNRRRSAVAWLPDFGGFAWIAYGASSLLVVSHFPSPLTPAEPVVGAFLRQVIESPGVDDVTSVAWRPSRPPDAHLAAAAGRFVRIYAPGAADGSGSLRWRQVASLEHSFAVEAIGWSGSGDGLISVGSDIVLWKQGLTTWDLLYKFKADNPQALVSASWSVHGPIATASYSTHCFVRRDEDVSPLVESDKCVLVHQDNGKSSFCTQCLWHPCSVTIIQWRPSNLTWANKSSLYQKREVLLTLCVDGIVRLWSEIDAGRARKFYKDVPDLKNTKQSYHVIAVVEINQYLKSAVSSDIFVTWGANIHAAVSIGGFGNCFAEENGNCNLVGCCDWLISMGPGPFLMFWAIHLLDDVSPVRFPRVSLWKKHDVNFFSMGHTCSFEFSNADDRPIVIDAMVARNQPFGLPESCSLLLLSHENSISWLHLQNPERLTVEGDSTSYLCEEKLSFSRVAYQNQDGHVGRILQIAVHPSCYEGEIAVSLDSHGLLLFWTITSILPSASGLEVVHIPTWQNLGRFCLQNFPNAPEYLNLAWVPFIINGDRFLLIGHGEGIDCFLVAISNIKGENIMCNKMFTISFSSLDTRNGPYQLYVMPTTSNCEQRYVYKFMLVGVWMKEFHVRSWELVMQPKDASKGTHCSYSEAAQCGLPSQYVFEYFYKKKSYHIVAHPFKSNFPSAVEQVTSFSVLPDNSAFLKQMLTSSKDLHTRFPINHVATGDSNGKLKLWTMKTMDVPFEHSSSNCLTWEMVGMLDAHQGPVGIISLTNSGTNVATVCIRNQSANSELNIWRLLPLGSCGCFSLEYSIHLDGSVVALSWVELGDGQTLLGVCMQKELRVYSQTRSVDMEVEDGKCGTTAPWFCIAQCHTNSSVNGFLWGTKLTPVLVHENSFSLFSQWSFPKGKVPKEECFTNHLCCYSHPFDGKQDEDSFQTGPSTSRNCNTRELPKFQKSFYSSSGAGLYNILSMCGTMFESLPVYHPKALIFYLYSGKCERAHMALQHLIELMHLSERSSITLKESSQGPRHCFKQLKLSKYFDTPVDMKNEKVDWNHSDFSSLSDQRYLQSANCAWEDPMENMSANSVSKPSILTNLKETLMNSEHSYFLDDIERNQVLAVIALLGELDSEQCSSTYKSFDEPARRFWIAARFKYLYFIEKLGRLPTKNEFIADSRMISWAYHSDSQDNLFNSIISPDPTWIEMRNMGVGYWFTDTMQLRTRMEKLARSQYLLKKDPKDCALLYLALNRLQVLAGLFRLSKDEKDKPLVGFLSRNFQEEKNKAAALKNAYVLLGRHQLELAIAFFLLGQDPSSAVMVCAKNLGDEQLALIICRLIEGSGGPIEHKLITNVLLPNAVGNRDYWLASLLEWTLGNYAESFKHLAESCLGSESATSDVFYNYASSADPNIGHYCAMLASNNRLRNSIGDHMAAMLFKWSISACANALNRCGFPLEALECMSSWINHNEAMEQNNQKPLSNTGNLGFLHGILNPCSPELSNWLSGDVATDLEHSYFLNVAMRYVSKFQLDCSSWQHDGMLCCVMLQKELLAFEDEKWMDIFTEEIDATISFLHRKYSLKPLDIISMMLVSSHSGGMVFPGFMLLAHVNSGVANEGNIELNTILLHEVISSILLKAMSETCFFLNRYILYCTFSESICGNAINESIHSWSYPWILSLNDFICSVTNLRIFAKLYGRTVAKRDIFLKTLFFLDYIGLFLSFASAWSAKNLRGLVILVSPIVNDLSKKESFHELIGGNITDFLCRILPFVHHGTSSRNIFQIDRNSMQRDESSSLMFQFFNEKWQFIGASLWMLLHDFFKQQLDPSATENFNCIGADPLTETMPIGFAQPLIMSLAYTSSLLRKHFISVLCWKVDQGFHSSTVFLLKESNPAGNHGGQQYSLNSISATSELDSNEDPASMLKCLFDISLHAGFCESFLNKKREYFSFSRQRSSWCWNGVHGDNKCQTGQTINLNLDNDFSMCNDDSNLLQGIGVLDKDAGAKSEDTNLSKEATDFFHPKDIFKRSGELIEAICSSCVDEHEAVLASNRKGLVFFNWANERCKRQVDYIWPQYDWPRDGWVEVDHALVSPGIDLDLRKSTESGSNGAASNTGTSARPGRDLTGGGAFGIPGYAGIGASGFGWSLQEVQENPMDLPATVDSISARVLSGHPSKPLFLVGSHSRAYLWEFRKEKATATFGTLESASVLHPPAPISALQFDHYGHRFASAAMDGIVCTWQLEIGGRRNLKPTESSLCFSEHACDIVYIGPSGSLVAAAGHSKNDVNIILWDTLAPPATSQASIFCHEGGASALSVFNNGIGCGSTSPIIVTGGRNGDVVLHDFRYIATGRMRRHRYSHEQSARLSSNSETSTGISRSCENLNGMLWYIEKAHLGSITKISTIPNTNLFLTGGKEGDVKLWDAKRAELVFHWPKLHEKHTFFRSSSRGIGGIVRAAVTDIQVLSGGFLTCGGDGTVKYIQLKDIYSS